jgi:hypothetical protein
MAGYVFEGTVCDECGGTHKVYLEEDGDFNWPNRYVFVCDQTGEIVTVERFGKVVTAQSRPPGSIVCLPG